MNELALFAGAGGGILAGRLLGWHTIAACEIEPYPRAVLLHNQKLGNLPHFPIWDDIRTLDGTPFRGHIDIVSGGFPCQDISSAGKGAGITGTRSGLWSEMHRIIREVQPRYAYMENSPILTSRGLGRVLGDLAEIGYHAAWLVLGAVDCGAPHRRDRIWILAVRNADSNHEAQKQTLSGRGKPTPQPCRNSGDGTMQTPPSHADSDRLQRPECRLEHDRSEIPAGRGEDWLESRRDLADPTGIGLQTSQRQPADLPAQSKHRTPDRTPGNGQNAHAPHTHLPGRQEQRSAEPAGTQHKTTKRSSWWRFEPRVGGSLDGLADKLDNNKHLSNEAKEHGKKILRNLWKGTFPQEIREAFRGFPSISEEEILLALLCQYNEESNSIRIQVESGTAPQTELRNLWRVIEAARTSHKWEHSGQFTREYSDALRIVSHQAPSLYTEAWLNGSWESGISRIAHGVASRVDRLKALGNGQVPLVAATAFQILKHRLDNIQP
jgi:DNA (cytosine-5)-methyltransferase 1